MTQPENEHDDDWRDYPSSWDPEFDDDGPEDEDPQHGTIDHSDA